MVLYFHTVALLCSVLLDSSHASALELLEEQPHPGTQERSTGNELASIPDLFPNRTLRLLDGESSETDGWSYNNTESDIYDDEQSSYGIDQFSNTTASSYEEVEEYSYIENEPQSASNGNSSLIVDAQYSNITGASALGPTPRRPFPDCPVAFIVLAGFSGILTALTGGLVIAKRVSVGLSRHNSTVEEPSFVSDILFAVTLSGQAREERRSRSDCYRCLSYFQSSQDIFRSQVD